MKNCKLIITRVVVAIAALVMTTHAVSSANPKSVRGVVQTGATWLQPTVAECSGHVVRGDRCAPGRSRTGDHRYFGSVHDSLQQEQFIEHLFFEG